MIKTAFLSVLSDGKAVFLCDRKFLPNYLSHKNLSEGCTARGREICLTAPLAREVCASTHFFINIGGQYGKGSLSRQF